MRVQKGLRSRQVLSRTALLLTLATTSLASHAHRAEAQSGNAHLPIAGRIAAPSGALDLCQRYTWACARPSDIRLAASDPHRLIKTVNRQINRRVRPVDDLAQYRTEDFWALPTARGGDCEDIALLKKRELMEQGFPGDRLLVATVFGKRVGAHAVLVVRLDDGDVVLDNMTDRIKPWHRTNYTFLRIQDPADPKSWARVSNRG